MDCPFTVTKQDGTVIKLKWRKKEKTPIIYKKNDNGDKNSIKQPKSQKKFLKKNIF